MRSGALFLLSLLSAALMACGSAPQAAAPAAQTGVADTAVATAVPAATAVPTRAPTEVRPSVTPQETAVPDQTRTPQLPDPSPTGPAPAPTTRPAPSIAPVAPTLGAAPAAGEVPADLLAMMKADAAQRSGVAVDSITVQQARALEWSDSSLGCPQPGVAYMQVITPGYQVVLQAGADMYDYHADERGRFVLCEK